MGKKVKNIQTLKKDLWKVFSEWIRRKDADFNGYATCVTCGIRKHWKELDAGHYIAKTAGLSVYFEEKNVHPQCTACNRFRHGNLAQYALYLKGKYGDQILEELDWKRKQKAEIKLGEYIKLIEIYKTKLKNL